VTDGQTEGGAIAYSAFCILLPRAKKGQCLTGKDAKGAIAITNM